MAAFDVTSTLLCSLLELHQTDSLHGRFSQMPAAFGLCYCTRWQYKHFLSSKHVMRRSIFSSVHNLSVFFFLPVSPPAVSADAAMFFSVWREIMGASERWLLGYKCCRSWQRGETSRNMYPCIAETQNVSASEQKQILLLGDAGNNASRVEKLENIGETCARYRCFWKRVYSFSQVTFHEGFSTNFPKYTGSTLSRPQVLLLCRHSRA